MFVARDPLSRAADMSTLFHDSHTTVGGNRRIVDMGNPNVYLTIYYRELMIFIITLDLHPR